jgi:hypothetical protein
LIIVVSPCPSAGPGLRRQENIAASVENLAAATWGINSGILEKGYSRE